MQRHEDTVTDSYGNVTPSASITVNVHGGGAATVYSDNGITILAQPFTPVQDITSPQYGRFFFYAADGRYDINVSFSGKTYTDPDVLLQDPTTDLSASSGSSLVGYLPAGPGMVASNIGQVLSENISFFRFLTAAQIADYLSATPALDLSTPMQAAATFIAANPTRYKLTFPSGICQYSVSPNWGITQAHIEAVGEVKLRYTGTGNAVIIDGGASVTQVLGMKFVGNWVVEAPGTALNGFFVRAIHHSVIEGLVISCGTTSAALLINFAVCTEFRVRTPNNEVSKYYSGVSPLKGLYATQRGSNELTSACTFLNPIFEAVTGDGIYLDYAQLNTFLGGTSEGNGGFGINLTANSLRNKFYGIDLESNTSGSLQDAGTDNSFYSINALQSVTITAAAVHSGFYDSFLFTITDNGDGTSFEDCEYTTWAKSSFGNWSGINMFNITYNNFDPDKASTTITTTTASVLNNTATTVATLSSTLTRMYHAYINLGNVSDVAYSSYSVICQDGATSKIMVAGNGTKMVISLSGQNIQAVQTSGSTQNVRCTLVELYSVPHS
jgi:hypothetical protein